MDNDCPLVTESSGGSGKSSLRTLNKSSHKISKTHLRNHQAPLPVAKPEPPADDTHPPPPQPPVYNIDKNDFRDVVQKLTGSPALPAAPMAPPPAKPTTPVASRFQKNRPPPLSQLGPRPPLPMAPLEATDWGVAGSYLRPWMSTPLSPLPPLPMVSAAAESPITAYMRCLRGGTGATTTAASSANAGGAPAGVPLFQMPTSPRGFGCLPSPQSAFQATVPSSPRVPIPSPKWKET